MGADGNNFLLGLNEIGSYVSVDVIEESQSLHRSHV